jgi:hypothetical protein
MLPAILSKKYLTGIAREYPTQAQIGADILPLVDVPGMETMWDIILTDSKLAPFVAVDAESPVADKAGIQRGFSELATIREKEIIKEGDLLSLRLPGEAGEMTGLVNTQRATADEKIRETITRMTSRVMSRVEWMRWQALSAGAIAYDDNRVIFSVDFGIPKDHIITLTSTDEWSDLTNSDPIDDLNDWIELVTLDAGYVPTRAYVGNSVPAYLANNAKIRDILKYNGRVESLINTRTVLGYLGDILGLSFQRYATQYQDGTGTGTFFLGADKVVIICEPRQADGESLGDVATGPAAANDWSPGIYSWVKEETDPWATFIGSGICAFPRIRHPKWILIANVNGA